MALLVITHNILHHLETRKSVKQLNLCHQILFSIFFCRLNCKIQRRLSEMRDERCTRESCLRKLKGKGLGRQLRYFVMIWNFFSLSRDKRHIFGSHSPYESAVSHVDSRLVTLYFSPDHSHVQFSHWTGLLPSCLEKIPR